MKVKYLSETSILIALLAVIGLCFLPGFRTGMAGMMAHSILVVIFITFAVFFWREVPQDERDITHQMFAGRVAFFVGIAVLLGEMLWQIYMMQGAEPFTIGALVAMVSAKIFARMYSQRYC